MDGCEQSKKIRTTEWTGAISKRTRGNLNPFYGKSHNKETRELMSSIKTEQIANGELDVLVNARGNKGYYESTKTNIIEKYDSELELVRMKMLDNDINVIHWTKKHGIYIPYTYNGIIKNYVPDFLITHLDGTVSLEETKGYDPKSKLKKEALRNYCNENGFICSWIPQHGTSEKTVLLMKEYRKYRISKLK